MSAFQALGLSAALQNAVHEAGLLQPTPVQAALLPALLAGGDAFAVAETGSGKTAAYALPLLQRLRAPARLGPRALVLLPSRELARQVAEVLRGFAAGARLNLRVALAFGGVSINPQLMALRGGCDVMVATPGRLLDLLAHNGLTLDAVQSLVLDEADRLLAAGFEAEWQRIEALLPRQRQTVLVSATAPAAVQGLADALLQADAARISLAAQPPDIQQRVLQCDAAQRTPLLRHLLASEPWQRVLVFVATRYAAEHVADKLWAAGIQAGSLHGELSQGARDQALAAIKTNTLRVLVATDVAARGLHIPALDAVVNYELPRAAADYVHRIGRTGRMGARGHAISFVCADSPTNAEAHMRLIEKRQGQRLPREQLDGFLPKAVASEQQATGGIKGKRPSKKDKLRALQPPP